MLFGKKEKLITVKYQIRTPEGYEIKKKKITEEKLAELENDPSVKILEKEEQKTSFADIADIKVEFLITN